MELWDIYDKNRVKTGKTIERGKKLLKNQYHLVVHIWILNSEGRFLIQKRSPNVLINPNKWSLTSGAAIAGEDSYGACIREVLEEIGIEPNMDNAKVIYTLKRRNNFCDIWLVKQDFQLNKCSLQKEEVSEVKWATIGDILKLMIKGDFVSYYYIKSFFSIIKKLV